MMQTYLKERMFVQTHTFTSDTSEPRLQRRRIDYMLENPNPHPYVKKWLEEPWIPTIRKDPNFKSFLNNTNLTKEFTESYGTLLKIKEVLGDDTEDLVFFDVCSGKGYLSCLLSYHFPSCTVHQIDNNTKIKTEHIRSLSNVEFQLIDIKGKKITELLTNTSKGKKGVLLGIHLCGELSEYMINFYNTIDDMKYLILCPCCISKKNQALLQTARDTKIDNYNLWTMELFFSIKSSTITLSRDDEVKSHKNNFIVCKKLPLPELPTEKEGKENTEPSVPSLKQLIQKHYCSYSTEFKPKQITFL